MKFYEKGAYFLVRLFLALVWTMALAIWIIFCLVSCLVFVLEKVSNWLSIILEKVKHYHDSV